MIGYGHESPIPVDQPWLNKWVGFWTKTTNIAICELRPVQMNCTVISPSAVFDLHVETNTEGGKRVIRRYTMTWKKALIPACPAGRAGRSCQP